jgi:hypothetical protein
VLHDNCVTAWVVFTQRMSHVTGGYAEATTTGDAYTEEKDALRGADAMTGPGQIAWIKRITVHLHR